MNLPDTQQGTDSPMRLSTAVCSRSDLLDVITTASDRREAVRCPQTSEESLVVDARSALSPAQMVENKLTRILRDASLPVSHLQMRGLLRNR